MAQLSNWWDRREPRERLLLSILAPVATLFILIFGLILPVQSARADATADLKRAQADLIAVSRLTPASEGAGRLPFDRSVLVTVARAQDVRLTRVQPGTDGTLSVWIDEAQTQRLYAFFDALLSDYAVGLDQVIVSADANGQLSAQFVVRG
ncbi:MAG: type II secretion system protein GspM [Pseudomonadota bacterium]